MRRPREAADQQQRNNYEGAVGKAAALIQAAEYAAYVREVNEFAARLEGPGKIKAKERTALAMLLQGKSGEEIGRLTVNAQGRNGISEKIVAPLRDKLTEIANRHLLTADDGLPYVDEYGNPTPIPTPEAHAAEWQPTESSTDLEAAIRPGKLMSATATYARWHRRMMTSIRS